MLQYTWQDGCWNMLELGGGGERTLGVGRQAQPWREEEVAFCSVQECGEKLRYCAWELVHPQLQAQAPNFIRHVLEVGVITEILFFDFVMKM